MRAHSLINDIGPPLALRTRHSVTVRRPASQFQIYLNIYPKRSHSVKNDHKNQNITKTRCKNQNAPHTRYFFKSCQSQCINCSPDQTTVIGRFTERSLRSALSTGPRIPQNPLASLRTIGTLAQCRGTVRLPPYTVAYTVAALGPALGGASQDGA